MPIKLSDNLQISVGAPIDSKYLNTSNAPYADIAEVTLTVPISQRYIGLTVNISTVEYWYKDSVADGDLVIKSGGGSGSGERIERSFTQTGHGFVLGEIVAYSGTTFIKAIADGSQNDLEVIGFVSEVVNVNEFIIVFAGYVNGLNSLSLNPNTTYYLSTTTAGELEPNDSSVFETVSKPVLTTFTNDDALVFQYRGFIVTSGASGSGGGTSSGITEIQNIGAGTGDIFESTLPNVSGQTSSLRTLLGSGGTTIVTSGNTIVINSDASGLYDLASPSNIAVGGLPVGTELTGKTSNELLEEILITTFDPTFNNPSNTFSDNASNLIEVGVIIPTINFSAAFDRGQILLQAAFQNFRSGLPNTYNYTGFGITPSVPSTSLTDGQILINYLVLNGANTWTNSVSYDAGAQPLDSNNDPSGSPLAAGTTSAKSTTITGQYPWFYGKVSSGGAAPGVSRPTANQALIDSGTKVVASSTGTITVSDFTSTSDDYIWIAIPDASAAKTIWFVNALNNGSIGGAVGGVNLFPDAAVVNIDSPTALWSNIDYKIIISNVQSTASIMEFRNS